MVFSRTVWVDNVAPGISATELNRIEQGIVDAQVGQAPVPIKQVKVATVANITLSGTQTIDGVVLSVGDRVLVKDQASASQNGIYDVASAAWSRSQDASSADLLPASTLVVVEKGTTNLDTIWMLTSDSPITLGTTSLTFARPAFPSADASASTKGSVFTSATPTVATSPTAVSINDPILETHMSGLQLQWGSATSITVKAGAAWIPGLARVYNVPSDIPKTGLSTAANTWYYVYLFDSSGTPSVEVVTTAPGSPYKGNAVTKSGDTSRRFLGALRANAAGTAIFDFGHDGDWILYMENINTSPFAVLSGGSATTETTVSCTAVVPPTARTARLRLQSNATAGINMGTSEDNLTLSSTVFLARQEPASSSETNFRLDASQAFSYLHSVSGGSSSVLVRGYQNVRA